MTEAMVMDLGAEALKTTFYLASPMLIAAMAVGLVVSVFQAITQINEATLSFIPKIFSVVLILVIFAPWMMDVMLSFSREIFGNFANWVR